jgi:hypothetical protein
MDCRRSGLKLRLWTFRLPGRVRGLRDRPARQVVERGERFADGEGSSRGMEAAHLGRLTRIAHRAT